MLAGLVALAETLACIGLGAAALRGLRVSSYLGAAERLVWAFALGFGILGWLLFFFGLAGLLAPLPLAALLAISATGIWFAIGDIRITAGLLRDWRPNGLVDIALLGGLALVVVFDFAEALAPPTDADTLAYHFELPRRFLAAQQLFFVPRAIDGAAPLLVQMTYAPALGLGGERALTLWTMISGWAASVFLFTLCRRHLNARWSLVAGLLFATTPGVIFGAGAGQVEVRLALFVMVAVISVSLALKTGLLRFAAVAGLAVGFFMAAKFTGLLFAVACGVAILFQRRWFAHGAVLTLTALVVGTQWYIWNAVNTGDPVFPMLYAWLKDVVDYRFWDQVHADYIKSGFFETDTPFPLNPYWLLIRYPLQATFSTVPGDSIGRTNLGIFGVMIAPFAAYGVWRFRLRLKSSPLMPLALITLVFYGLWYFTGSSHRIRHLVPIYPVFVACVLIAATRTADAKPIARPLATAIGLILLIQLGGHGLFSSNYLQRLAANETRQQFLAQNLAGAPTVDWINRNLTQDDRIYVEDRELLYLINVPTFYAHPILQAQIDLAPQTSTLEKFLRQIRALGITHALTRRQNDISTKWFDALLTAGCAVPIQSLASEGIASRALARAGLERGIPLRFRVLKMNVNGCAGLDFETRGSTSSGPKK